MVRIADIVPGTIADELQLEIGSRVVRINGEAVRDIVDLRFLEADGSIEIEIASPCSGERTLYEIEKDEGEGLGIVPAPDTVRQCANKCVFCFVDGNPEGARKSLHLKDDDFRLSFTYGSYVTLTNLGPKGFERLIEQRLSPLYVSVHATDPELRERLLGVPRGGDIVEQLKALTAAGLEVHTQIVLCPEWNDGAQLTRTIEELWEIGPGVLSLSVVPVGLTQYNLNRPIRMLTQDEALDAIARVDAARERAFAERGMGWAYVGDEMFFIAGHDLPPADYYDDWPLTENGVGAVRTLVDNFAAAFDSLRDVAGKRIALVTGTRMAPVFAPLLARYNSERGADAEVIGVENGMFGPTVSTAGLLPAASILSALRGRSYDVVLLPAEALNDDERFIDDVTLESVREAMSPAAVVPAFDLAAALGTL
jgi:putative radical SAM enzyme (TIGR03279 family)